MRVMIALFLSIFMAGAATAEREISWVDLVDQAAQTYEDPYRDLTYEQIDDLRLVLRLRMQLTEGEVAANERPKLETLLEETLQALADQGIDADWLIGQRWVVAERREKAARAGNPAVDGQTVVLTGFAIPAPNDADGTGVVYLVPERGMCSHVPPPPPNQMLRVRLNSDWRPSFIHEPVRLTGRISIEPTEQVMRVVDGMVPMQATFEMEAVQVDSFADLKAEAEAEAAVRANHGQSTGASR